MAVFHDSRIDRVALRSYRLGRVREQLRKRDYAGILLYDPLNIRYATDASNMQVWTMHNKVRYAWVPTQGPIVLFDFHGCDHIHEGNEVIGELRPGISYFYFENGPRCDERVEVWADEIAELVRRDGGANRRIAVDKIEPRANAALGNRQLGFLDGEEVMELARVIKNELEIDAMMEAVEGCEEGMRRMQEALEPGISENKLWSILHAANIELGGEWIETRLLSSGPRTFPGSANARSARIEAGDMVSFDTDLIGPGGYCSDLSRSWLCGDGKPTAQKRADYGIARAQIEHNIGTSSGRGELQRVRGASYRLPEEVSP